MNEQRLAVLLVIFALAIIGMAIRVSFVAIAMSEQQERIETLQRTVQAMSANQTDYQVTR